MRTLGLAAALCVAAILSGCREARIAMPSELAKATETLEIGGMGYGRRGDFTLAGSEGRFTRGADRLELFSAALVRNSGAGSFSYARLQGACRYREGEVNVGIISATTRPFAYHCQFERNGVPAGELVIGEQTGTTGALLGKRGREGYLAFDGGLAAATPLGYRFDAGGRAVGAVDLNGGNKTLFAPRTGSAREAVFAGGLALSILWDPATM
jgi:hypothetical protein